MMPLPLGMLCSYQKRREVIEQCDVVTTIDHYSIYRVTVVQPHPLFLWRQQDTKPSSSSADESAGAAAVAAPPVTTGGKGGGSTAAAAAAAAAAAGADGDASGDAEGGSATRASKNKVSKQ